MSYAVISSNPLHPDVERAALLGWRLTPVWPNRAGCFVGYLKAATWDLGQLERWTSEYPGCNWSVLPQGSGVWAIDVDIPSASHEADGWGKLQEMLAIHGPLPAQPYGRSGGGGHLLIFQDVGQPIKTETGWPFPGWDCRAGRVQFTISPSRYKKTKAPYHWVTPPWEVNAPIAPAWLAKLVAPPPERARPARPKIMTRDSASRTLANTINMLIAAVPGRRNSALNRAAYIAGALYGARLMDEADAVSALYAAGRHIGLSDVECRATIRSGFKAGEQNPFGGDR